MARPQLDEPISFEQLVDELAECVERSPMEGAWEVVIDDELTEEHLRNPRRYAAVTAHAPVPCFAFAEQVLLLPYSHRLGLYAHEIGHVLDPDPKKTEDGADLHGMLALDLLIVYDHRWPGKGLQTAVR